MRFACSDRRERGGERIPGKKILWFPSLNKVEGTEWKEKRV